MFEAIKEEGRAELQAFRNDKRAYTVATFKKVLPILVMVAVFALAVGSSFAQEPTAVTLDLDAGELTNGLFSGANIIIAALGAIMF